MNFFKNEPVTSAILAVVTTGAALLVAFGVHLTDVQIGAISTFGGAVIVLGGILRSKVTPLSNPKTKATTIVPLVTTSEVALAADVPPSAVAPSAAVVVGPVAVDTRSFGPPVQP